MSTQSRKLFDPRILGGAVKDAFLKLSPRHQLRNPVMFVVFVGSMLTTLLIFVGELGVTRSFIIATTVWLWCLLTWGRIASMSDCGTRVSGCHSFAPHRPR